MADALAAADGEKPRSADELQARVVEILRDAREAKVEGYPAAVGVGLDERYAGDLSLGKGLSFKGDLIHFSAFAK